MTDTEINEAVARKLGWIKDRRFMDDHLSAVGWGRGSEFIQHPVDYCHSIAAAWEVVEWMLKNGHDFNMSCDESSFGIAWKYDEYIVEADTAPMAICLAFLRVP